MGKKYLHYDQQQTLILPPNLDDWLPKDHLARFISNVVDSFDLSKISSYYEDESRGGPPYDPVMMTTVRLYADCKGCPSSRVIERKMVEDIPFRYLGAGNFPDHRTISDFRKIHHKALSELFDQVLSLCQIAGLVEAKTVAIDGMKIKANASMDKNRTMKKLTELERQLIKEIARKTIEDGIKVDEEEDRKYGKDNSGWKMPEDALERVKRAKKQLDEMQKKEQEQYQKQIDERRKKEAETGMKLRGRKPLSPDKKKDAKEKKPVANTTDPDSRIMKTRRGFTQGYSGQLAVDADSQIIVATELTQDQNDLKQFTPMVDQVIENIGKVPENILADAGYDNSTQIEPYNDRCNVLVPTQKDWKQRKAMREQPSPRGRIPKRLSERERRERKLLTKKGKALYKKRGSSVEPVNGQINSARGLNKLLLRGFEKAKSEWKMYSTGHNLLKLWRHMMNMASC